MTGGVGLDSTEIFDGGEWKFADPLPRKDYGLQGVSLGNIVYMIGTMHFIVLELQGAPRPIVLVPVPMSV